MSIATTQTPNTIHVRFKPKTGIEIHQRLAKKTVRNIANLFRTQRPTKQTALHKSFIEANTLHPTLGPEISRTLRR